MSSVVPVLDTADFDELVERARGQIPRYAPEWTDHNLHDPGITLIDLLAWVVDQQIYRVGFVSDGHLEAFAALLGAVRHGPTAARAVIWPDRPLESGRSLALGAAIVCIRQPDIPFMLDEQLHLTAARLTEMVVARDSGELRLRNEGGRTAAFVLGPTARGQSSSLVMRFDRPLVAEAPAVVSLGFDIEAPPGEPPDASHQWGPLACSYRQGDGSWHEAAIVRDSTAALSMTGSLSVEVPTLTTGGGWEPSELRLSLDRGFFPIAPRVRRVEVNVLPVVQQSVEKPGVIDVGTGLPDQAVPFDTSTLLDGEKLEIWVADDRWTEVEHFRTSGPDDLHYLRRPDRLVFGNGVNGRCPPREAQIRHGGVTRTLGDQGMLRPGLAWRVPALAEAGERFGTNLHPTAGGAPASTIDDLIADARRSATGRQALLTDETLIAAALQLPGFAVARAEVLAGFHPHVPDRRIDGARTLIVIPHHDHDEPPAGVEQAYVDEVGRLLATRRTLGERLFFRSHRLVHVDIGLTVVIEPGAESHAISADIADRLRARFADIARRDDIAPWPLGRMVTHQEVEAIASRCDGVVAVTSCVVSRSGEPGGEGPIELRRDEVAVASDESIRIEVVRS
jgi:hypothetical protein